MNFALDTPAQEVHMNVIDPILLVISYAWKDETLIYFTWYLGLQLLQHEPYATSLFFLRIQ